MRWREIGDDNFMNSRFAAILICSDAISVKTLNCKGSQEAKYKMVEPTNNNATMISKNEFDIFYSEVDAQQIALQPPPRNLQ